MQTLVSFPASATRPEELGRILSDYLAVDRARVRRRLMVARFGVLALGAAVLETFVRELAPFVRLITIGLCLVPPAWARIVEIRSRRRLSRRIEGVPGAVSYAVPLRSAPNSPRT